MVPEEAQEDMRPQQLRHGAGQWKFASIEYISLLSSTLYLKKLPALCKVFFHTIRSHYKQFRVPYTIFSIHVGMVVLEILSGIPGGSLSHKLRIVIKLVLYTC